MFQLLLIIIYLSFISLGLPDALLGAAAVHSSGISDSGFLCRSHFHDHFRGNHHFQSAE